MEPITILGVVFLPHTFGFVFGLPLFLITSALVAGVYELITKHSEH